jgi:AraC family transcriptional regulator
MATGSMRSPAWRSHDTGPRASDSGLPLDSIVFASPSITIGSFRCPPGHPSFADSGPIQNHIFVFPRRRVRLCHEGGLSFLADPGVVTVYNRGQRYSRLAVSPDGDHCEWFAVEREILLDAVASHEPAARDRPERPFRHAYAPCPARTYLEQRALFERLQSREPIDPLRVEEAVLGLLASVLSSLYAHWGARGRESGVTRRQLETADHVRRLLGERLGDSLRLAEVAAAIGLSPYHLCRSFRAATGSSLHAYRNQMRLQEALNRFGSGQDLTRIALDLGYSSHSHFTSAFRSLFGVTPSRARGRLRRAGKCRGPRLVSGY